MNFNVYLDERTAQRLALYAKRRRMTRNAIIREAVADWIGRNGESKWPERVMAARGEPKFAPFESHRDELKSATDDPFAGA